MVASSLPMRDDCQQRGRHTAGRWNGSAPCPSGALRATRNSSEGEDLLGVGERTCALALSPCGATRRALLFCAFLLLAVRGPVLSSLLSGRKVNAPPMGDPVGDPVAGHVSSQLDEHVSICLCITPLGRCGHSCLERLRGVKVLSRAGLEPRPFTHNVAASPSRRHFLVSAWSRHPLEGHRTPCLPRGPPV